jgi:SAM-dependent MidA family methyltransferase
MILIDYGHEARELYSAAHSSGTLTTFAAHRSAGPESAAPAWLANPGEQDITAHVDFTGIRQAAELEGMETLALLDQTYFLFPFLPPAFEPQSAGRQFMTLIDPGGLGGRMKVLLLAKNVGRPTLQGCRMVRVT